jgi:predicted transcriptional regulator
MWVVWKHFGFRLQSRKLIKQLAQSLVDIQKVFALQLSYIETYVEILKIIAHYGPLTETHIERNTNVNSSVLRGYLDYFLAQGLIEEQRIGKGEESQTLLKITKTGFTLFRYFLGKTQILPNVEVELETEEAISYQAIH